MAIASKTASLINKNLYFDFTKIVGITGIKL